MLIVQGQDLPFELIVQCAANATTDPPDAGNSREGLRALALHADVLGLRTKSSRMGMNTSRRMPASIATAP